MAVSVPLALMAAIQAGAPVLTGANGEACLTGFCALPVQGGMPGGLMYLALGLVWLGVTRLRQERRSARRPDAGGSG